MQKVINAGILAVFSLFLPLRSHAVPLDVPYQILVTTTNTGSVVISTANFSGGSAINANVASYQWCINHMVVSAANAASTVTIAWSTSTLTAATTDYQILTSTGVAFDERWPYRTPYCAPVGQPVVKVNSTQSTANVSIEGYLFKGWNP